jgi:hypothetical protein
MTTLTHRPDDEAVSISETLVSFYLMAHRPRRESSRRCVNLKSRQVNEFA